LFEHDLFQKSGSTFWDHAVGASRASGVDLGNSEAAMGRLNEAPEAGRLQR
jgi:hypothetical protein